MTRRNRAFGLQEATGHIVRNPMKCESETGMEETPRPAAPRLYGGSSEEQKPASLRRESKLEAEKTCVFTLDESTMEQKLHVIKAFSGFSVAKTSSERKSSFTVKAKNSRAASTDVLESTTYSIIDNNYRILDQTASKRHLTVSL